MTEYRSTPYGSMPSTRWVLVAQASGEVDPRQRAALEALLRRYLPALRAHLVFQRRIPPEQAEDMLQSFVVSKVLERALIGRADPTRGRFRTFLLTSLDRFVISLMRAAQAERRSPAPATLVELQAELERRQEPMLPGAAFEVAWARQVLDGAVQRMYLECQNAGRLDLWQVFEARVLAPLLQDVTPMSYAEMVGRFGFTSPGQASNALTTAKRMFARTLREVVSEYVREPEHVEVELLELKQILAGAGT